MRHICMHVGGPEFYRNLHCYMVAYNLGFHEYQDNTGNRRIYQPT